jgi:hypothetical protein
MTQEFTPDEIIEMAKVAGCDIRNGHAYNPHVGSLDQILKNFAKLVADKAAAKKREACAAECERMMMYPNARQESAAHQNVWAAAKAIRARGVA